MDTAAAVDEYLRQARIVLGTGRPAIAQPATQPGAPPAQPSAWDGTASVAATTTSTRLHQGRTTLASRHTQANTVITSAADIATNAHTQLNIIETDWRTDQASLEPFRHTPEGQAALNRAGTQRISETQALVSGVAAQYSGAANAIRGTTDGLPQPDPHHRGDHPDQTDDDPNNPDGTAPDDTDPLTKPPKSNALGGSTPPTTSALNPTTAPLAGMPAGGMPMGAMPMGGMPMGGGGSPMSGGGLSSLLQPLASQATSLASAAHQPAGDNTDSGPDSDSDPSTGSSVVRNADRALGLPYIWGGGNTAGPTGGGFDCSGLTQWAVAQATNGHVMLPRTTYDQIHVGRSIDPNDARPGDLIFSNFSSPGVPEHVQIYAGEGKVIEAQQSGVPVKYSRAPSGDIVVRRVV